DPSGQVELTFTLLTRIPGTHVSAPWYHPQAAGCFRCTVHGDGTGERGIKWMHDVKQLDRMNWFRTAQQVTVETDPDKAPNNPVVGTPFQRAGLSIMADENGNALTAGRTKEVGTIKASRDKDGNTIVDIHVDSTIPLFKGAPAIDADIHITISKD